MKLTDKIKPSDFPKAIRLGALGRKIDEYILAFGIVDFCLRAGDRWIAFSAFEMSRELYLSITSQAMQNMLESMRDAYGILENTPSGEFQINDKFIRSLTVEATTEDIVVPATMTYEKKAALVKIISKPT